MYTQCLIVKVLNKGEDPKKTFTDKMEMGEPLVFLREAGLDLII